MFLQSDTDCVKGKAAPQQVAKPGKVWQSTQYSNLIRYVPSGTFFARWRVGGNLIRKSLKTDLLTVAKLRLADLDKNERGFVETRQTAGRGRMTFGDCLGIFKTQTETSSLLKPSVKRYRVEVVKSILESWPGLKLRAIRRRAFSPGVQRRPFRNSLALFSCGRS